MLSRFDAILAAARDGGSPLSQRAIVALCGEWYRAECARYGDNPGSEADWELLLECQADQLEDTGSSSNPEDWGYEIRLKPSDRDEAAALLRQHGYTADDAGVTRMAEALFWTRRDLANFMLRRAGGDWSPDPMLSKFPTLPTRKAPEPATADVTFDALISAWAAESGTGGKALYDRQRTAANLARHLGHDNATRVTADDVVSWKEARLAAGKSTKTVANDIGELRPIWSWAKRNRKLTFAENPFTGLAPKTKKRSGVRVRGPYTDDEARRLLQAARVESAASLRWLPWVLCFTGARLGEVTQAVKEDVRHDGSGPWFIHIHEQGAARTLKTPHSERMVPLHPALVDEGFLLHVHDLPAGSSLFPDLRPDKFGMLKGTATQKHGTWVRRTVGIVDRSKDPAHAWRHRFEDQARRAGVPQNVTDGLMGHLNSANESEGYGRGFRFMPDVTAPWIAKLAPPLLPVTKGAA